MDWEKGRFGATRVVFSWLGCQQLPRLRLPALMLGYHYLVGPNVYLVGHTLHALVGLII